MNQLTLPFTVLGIVLTAPVPATMILSPDEDVMASSFFFAPNSVRGYAGEGRTVFRVSTDDPFGTTGAETIYLSFQSADLSSYSGPINQALLTVTSVDGGFNANASATTPFKVSAHALNANPITSITDDTNLGGTTDWLTFYNTNILASAPEAFVDVNSFGAVKIDVTSIVNDWISGDNSERFIALTGKNDLSGNEFLHGFLNNSETPGSSFLVIDPIPEPSMGVFVLLATSWIGLRRRRLLVPTTSL